MSNRKAGWCSVAYRAVKVLGVLWIVAMLAVVPAVGQTNASETNPCEYGPPVPSSLSASGGGGLELALTFDTSQSMDINNRIVEARAAGKTFVGELQSPQEVAISEFQGDSATLEQPLTTNYAAANESIDGLVTDGTSANFQFAEGIELTTDELLNGTAATDDGKKVMVILTDTGNTPQDAVTAAEFARSRGITIYAVGIGDSVDEAYLAELTGDSGRVYLADSGNLGSVIGEVSGDVLAGQLRVETRDLYKPGESHPYSVYNVTYGVENGETVVVDREEVTEAANLSTTNTSVLSVDESNNSLVASSDANTSTWVRVDASYSGVTGCTNVIVAEPTVQNLQLVPGIWRISAVAGDSTMFALLIATLMAVPAARFTSAFGGLAIGEMVIVVGWLGGYIGFGIAAASVFVSMFIGLNLAANINYMGGRLGGGR